MSGNVRVKTREDNVAVTELRGLALADNHVANDTDGGGLLPSDSVLVLLACGARRGADSVELQCRMLGEEEDEALAYRACTSKDTYMILSV